MLNQIKIPGLILKALGLSALLIISMSAVRAQGNDSLTIKEIKISGNRITHDQVILREITLHSGDRFTPAGLIENMRTSEKFLTNTSLYLYVHITDSISASQVYIYIKVKERFNIDFWHPQLKVADRDINVWLANPTLYRLTLGLPVYISNLTGYNDRLTLTAIVGWRETLGLDYKFPYLNKAKTLGIEALFNYQQGHEVGDTTRNNQLEYIRVDQRNIFHKLSFEADITYRKRYQVSHIFSLGFDYYHVDDTISRYTNPNYLGGGRSMINVPWIAYNFVLDKRDYVIYAHQGDYLNLSIQQSGLPLISRDVNITTLNFLYRKFIPLPAHFFYEGGARSVYNLQKDLPYIFLSSLGYRYLVAGFEHSLIDGRAYAMAENELKYLVFSRNYHLPVIKEGQFNPVPLNIYLKVFADQGAVFYDYPANNNSLTNKLLSGWGAGFDLTSYYDFVMRVEYSFNNLAQKGLFLHFTEVF